MKKVLLGLLALSATLMAEPSTGVADGNGGNQIDINTKAFIVDSGLIITGSSDTAIKSVELDHGTIMVGANTLPAVSKEVFIRKSNKQAFPTNSILEISLAGNSDLVNGNSRIPHTLTATIGDGASSATSNDNVLTIANSDASTTETNQFSTTDRATAVKVALQSTINPSTVTSDLTEGEYNNKSTLSVKFSKIPSTSNNETAAESQPAGTSR